MGRVDEESSDLGGLDLGSAKSGRRLGSGLERCVRGTSVGDVLGENSGDGKIGSTFDVSERGEPGRVDVEGGGVEDLARGLA